MEVTNAIGRRKAAVARVYVTPGKGTITINKRDLAVYFPSSILQFVVKQPLVKLGVAENYDIKVNLNGGGYKGHAEALRLAIARALVKINPEDKPALKAEGKNPFTLTSKEGDGSYQAFLANETRYSSLTRKFPERAEFLFKKNEEVAKARFEHLQKLVELYK